MSASCGLQLGLAAHRFPTLVAHLGDRPIVLHGAFQIHFGVGPIQRRLEVAPVQPGVLLVHLAEPLEDAAEPADVLRGDAADLPAPGVVGVACGRGIGLLQGRAPLAR